MHTITARIEHPVMAVPGALKHLIAFSNAAVEAGLDKDLAELLALRASQINGCAFCIDLHAKALKEAGETDERLFGVAAWRETPHFTEAERAALALAESMSRISDQADPVPDAVWDAAAEHFDAGQLAALCVSIAAINTWNRLNVAVRQPAGATWG